MPSYFPSKKVLVVGVLAIGLLAWSIVYQNTSQKSSAITNNPLRTVAQAESAFPDTDSDGLYNWEEVLYGTDIKNPDSDGDGVLDGKQYVSTTDDVNVRLSDSVYSAVSRVNEEIQNTPNPVDLLTQEPKNYEAPFDVHNLVITKDSSENHQEYIAQVFLGLSPHAEILSNDPLVLFEEWLESKKPSVLDEILKSNEITRDIAKSLLEISVPPKYTETHLSIANNLYLSGLALDDVKATNQDPMAGFFAAAGYVNYQSKYIDAVYSLGKIDNLNEENES